MTCSNKTKIMHGLFLPLFLLGIVVSSPAHAQVNWTGGTDTDWTNDDNWDGVEPTDSDSSYINTTTNAPIINAPGAVSDNSYIGNTATATGAVTVTGAGSTWTSSSDLLVGVEGNGTLNIENGGAVSNTYGYIGYEEDSIGAVTVTGAGSTWTSSSGLYVGDYGNGTLNIEDGGEVAFSFGNIGNKADSIGVVNVTGAGSTFAPTSNFRVGYGGNGTLNIANGGLVSFTGTAYAGSNAGSTGAVTITGSGSTLSSTGDFVFGNSGNATLTIEDGGALNLRMGRLGYGAGTTGTATVTGAGSTWTNSSYIYVGNDGDGTLNIENGGLVTSSSHYLGDDAAATGIVTVTGAGSEWQSGNGGYTGYDGTGTLNIENGGLVSFTGTGYMGYRTGSTGAATITGTDSTWSSAGDLVVGYTGDATVTVEDGGEVNLRTGNIGFNSGSTSSATVTGTGSTWANSLNLFIGNAGDGTLTVSDGGSISATDIIIADNASSTSTLNIGAATGQTAVASGSVSASTLTFGSGTANIIFNHTDTDYIFASDITGAGTMTAENGTTSLTGDLSTYTGTTSATDTAVLNITGNYGGNLLIDSGGTIAANSTITGTVAVNNGGTLKGSGTIGGAVVASGGIVAPGNSIGTLNVAGNISFASGSFLDVEVDADGNTDLTHATGTATLTGGTVRLVPELVGDTYAIGSPYTILTADGGVGGTFDTAIANSIFFTPTLSYDATNVYATIARNGTSFSSLALTFNEQQVAAVLDAAPTIAASNAVASQSNAAATRFALDSLSGELHANIKASAIENDMGFASVVSSQEEPGYWVSYYGNWTEHSGDATHEFNTNTNGVAFGLRSAIDNTTEVGIAFGYDRSSYEQTAIGDNSAEGDANHYRIGGQAKYAKDNLTLKGNAHYAYHAYNTDRRVAFPSYDSTQDADYNGHSVMGFAEAAYAFKLAPQATLQPFANIAYGYTTLGEFNETGDTGLRSDGESYFAGASTIGVRTHYGLTIDGTPTVLKAELGWKHNIGNATPKGSYSFNGSSSFQSQGTKRQRNSVAIKASADMYLADDLKLDVSYTGDQSGSLSSHSIQTNLKYQF